MKYIFLILFNFLNLYGYLIELDNKCFKEYYETNLKNPVLAYYTLTKEEVEKKNPIRLSYFKADKRIPIQFRVCNKDYCNSGYDRGHLVGNNIIDYDIDCQKYSFLTSNITPQSKKFNRSIYKKLENYELELAKYEGKIFVIVGNWGSLGHIKNDINIPKYYFKIFVTKNKIYYYILDTNGNKYKLNFLKNYPYFNLLIKILFGD